MGDSITKSDATPPSNWFKNLIINKINMLHDNIHVLYYFKSQQYFGYAPPMRILMFLLSLVLAGAAYANPPESDDAMVGLLSERGLLARISDVGIEVGAKASDLVINAMGFLGVPYRRGGSSIDTGFDCSGFVRAIYEQTAGLLLPRNAAQQAATTQKIERSDLQPGDLVFFNTFEPIDLMSNSIMQHQQVPMLYEKTQGGSPPNLYIGKVRYILGRAQTWTGL